MLVSSQVGEFRVIDTIPDLSYYNTKHMKVHKKKECEIWHAKEVLKGTHERRLSQICRGHQT